MNEINIKKRNSETPYNTANKRYKDKKVSVSFLNQTCIGIQTKEYDNKLDKLSDFQFIISQSKNIKSILKDRSIDTDESPHNPNTHVKKENLTNLSKNIETVYPSIKDYLSNQKKFLEENLIQKIKTILNINIDDISQDINLDSLKNICVNLQKKSNLRNPKLDIWTDCSNKRKEGKIGLFLRLLSEEIVTDTIDRSELLDHVEKNSETIIKLIDQYIPENDPNFDNDIKYFIDTLNWALSWESTKLESWVNPILERIKTLTESVPLDTLPKL